MMRRHRFQFVLLLFSFAAVLLPSAVAQVVVATVPAGVEPLATAVNPATNNIYVVNSACTSIDGCTTAGTVTVINGATNNPTTVNVGVFPVAVAVNLQTNQIYVVNECGNDITCSSPGTVTVIDGATNNTTTVNVGVYPDAVAVNQITNQIYVANQCGNDLTCSSPGTVTVIAGGSNNIGSVQVEYIPSDVEINSVTNQIYVVNLCGNDVNCGSNGTVTVINGATDNTTNVNVGAYPFVAAINSVTNQIYVPNNCGNDLTCSSLGTVTIIDGATNNTTNLIVGAYPFGVSVNAVTNNIYVVNNCGTDLTCSSPGTVTVIAGSTITTTVTVGNMSASNFTSNAAVDAVTNQIYVPNSFDGTVTDIDGATNNTTTVDVGNGPNAAAMNALTNRVYVDNYTDGTVSVIAGTGSPSPLQLFPVTPCRLVDTRSNGGPIAGETSRVFNLPQLAQSASPPCASLASAAAYSLNVTVVPIVPLGYLTIWPTGEDQPYVSTMNSPDGRIKANAAIVPAGYQGSVSVYVSNTADVILDIDGYFEPPASGTYQFYPLTPCRIVDTRNGKDQGTLEAGVERDYLIAGTCGIPSNATAYSFNVTVLPAAGGLDYLTVWPKGEAQPVVSTLNDNTGTVVANAAIVPAGSDGSTAFYAHNNDTDLLLDVDGYFAAPGTGGLSMYSVPPCRVLDTRQSGGSFVGEKTVNVVGSACAPPVSAAAYIFNATVVPPGPMLYLTLWPDGEQQPTVSTLNAEDGFITSNMAIVPTNNGSIDAYAYALTQLILDISGYFAP
ncbi:MAG: YncE family protein [Candidatus Korobacteraceae bacterium]